MSADNSESEDAKRGQLHPLVARHWPHLTLITVLLIFLICVWLWQFADLRPYLAAAGAATTAFAGPLPGLLSPEMRGKWLFTIGITILIGIGGFFATKDLQDRSEALTGQLNSAQTRTAELDHRMNAEREVIGSLIRLQGAHLSNAFLLEAGRQERVLFRNRQYSTILDLAQTIIEIDPDNGHGLYYAGEAYRHARDWGQMRDMFQKFLAAAESISEARTGAATVCYSRPRGYCNERVAYVDHLMALEFLRVAADLQGESRVEALNSAFRYGRADLEARPEGFRGDGPYLSSCEVLRSVERYLRDLRRSAVRVTEFLETEDECRS